MLIYPAFDPVAVQLGPVAVHWYGLAYVVALLGGLWLAQRVRAVAPASPVTAQRLDDFLLWAVLGVVLPAGAPPMASLNDLGERKLGAVAGTLGGAVAMGWKFGTLRNRVVTLNQRENPLDELARPPAGTAPRSCSSSPRTVSTARSKRTTSSVTCSGGIS